MDNNYEFYEDRAKELEGKLAKMAQLVRENRANGTFGLSPKGRQLKLDVDEQTHKIDVLTTRLDEMIAQVGANTLLLGGEVCSTQELGKVYSTEMNELRKVNLLGSKRGAGPKEDLSIPPIVEACVGYLYNFVTTKRLFNAQQKDPVAAKALVAKFDNGAQPSLESWTKPHVVAEALLHYFQEQCKANAMLSNPKLYIQIAREQPNAELAAFEYHKLVNKLPTRTRYILRELFGLLSEVAKESEANRMTAGRLAEVWAPVLWNSTSNVARACEIMIERDQFVFEDARSFREFHGAKDRVGQSAWMQYDSSMYSRGNIGNKAAYAGHAGV